MIFSLPKLMALAGVIWAVWMGFKYLERRKGGDEGADSGGDQAEKGHRALDSSGNSPDVQDIHHPSRP